MQSTIEWTPTVPQVPPAPEQLSIGFTGRIKKALGRNVYVRLSRRQKEAARRGHIPAAPFALARPEREGRGDVNWLAEASGVRLDLGRDNDWLRGARAADRAMAPASLAVVAGVLPDCMPQTVSTPPNTAGRPVVRRPWASCRGRRAFAHRADLGD